MRSPLTESSTHTSIYTSMDEVKAREIEASTVTTLPCGMVLLKETELTAAVTTTHPEWRTAAMVPTLSIRASSSPPNIFP